MKKYLTWALPFLVFVLTLGIARWFTKDIIPFIWILTGSTLLALYVGYYLWYDQPARDTHRGWIRDNIPYSEHLLGFTSPAGVICILIALSMLIASLTVTDKVIGWFMPVFLTRIIGTIVWVWAFFTYIFPEMIVYVEPNTGTVINNDILKNRADPIASQRELTAGFSPVIPFVESEVATISTKWIQIQVPATFRAQTKNKVEVGFGDTYHRIRIPHGKLSTANNHGLEEIKQAFLTRLLGWLTEASKKYHADDIPNKLGELERDFVDKFGLPDPDRLEEKYGGIVCSELKIGDVILPPSVVAANALDAIMVPVIKQANKAVKKSGDRLTWHDAMIWVTAAMSKLDPNLAFLATFGNFGNNQGNRGRQNRGNNNNNQQQNPPQQGPPGVI